MFMSFESLVHSLIRFYCSTSPIEYGKGYLQKLGRKLLHGKSLIVPSKHGILLELTFPEDAGWEMLYYRGTFETGTTDVISQLLRPDDVVFDIGANLGWYTIHSRNIAPMGECHAFEPVGFIYKKLIRNLEINNISNKTYTQNVAVGDKVKAEVTLYTFEELYHGHSSLSKLDRDDFKEFKAPMTTLDEYVDTQGITRLDLIKMDTEGAELNVLKGANKILRRNNPPVWIIELNMETSAKFRHTPTQILDYIASKNNYRFYRIVRGWRGFKQMQSTSDYQNGDNAVCIPMCRQDLLL